MAQQVLDRLSSERTPLLCAMMEAKDPDSFKQAAASLESDAWMKAMEKEMASLVEKKVFDLVPLPKGKKAIGCRWAYKTKYVYGKVERYKARLVAKGYLQRKGVDFHETYAPSTRAETIRILMSHMAQEAWESRQMDVMTAFLNSLLQEEVYLKQPEGFVDPEHPTWVWRVRASLYGLQQAPREWNTMLTKKLISDGLDQSKHDPVLFTKRENGKVVGAVIAHVDDLYVTGEPSFVSKESEKLSQPSRCQNPVLWTLTCLSRLIEIREVLYFSVSYPTSIRSLRTISLLTPNLLMSHATPFSLTSHHNPNSLSHITRTLSYSE